MIYYEIDERIAQVAWDMAHMSDYKLGSTTAEYRHMVDQCAELVAAKKESVSPFYHDKLDHLLDRYARRLAEWYNATSRNDASCPSVLVSGPANFPVRKKQKQNARSAALYKEWEEIEAIKNKIRSIGTGAIDPTDPDARAIHQQRLESYQAELERAKAMNAYHRKYKTMQGFPGIDDDQAAKMDAEIAGSYSWAQKPYPDYELASLRNKIKRAQENLAKLDDLEAMRSAPVQELAFDGGHVVENATENRLQIFFDDRPDEETRSKLKSHGFRWSPKNQAWQRRLTQNALYDVRCLLGISTPTKPTSEEHTEQPSTEPAAPQPQDKTPQEIPLTDDFSQLTLT